ncbi:MAG: hypothetical protein AAF198_04635 [Pseudomonadota bacterium]
MDYRQTYLLEDLFRIADGFPMHLLRSRKALMAELGHLLQMLPPMADDWDELITH